MTLTDRNTQRVSTPKQNRKNYKYMILKLIFFPLYMRDENWMRQLNTLSFYIKNTSYDEVYIKSHFTWRIMVDRLDLPKSLI